MKILDNNDIRLNSFINVADKLKEIESLFINTNSRTYGLYTGNSGIILFLIYYSSISDKPYSDRIVELLEKSIKKINTGNIKYSFCDGLSGFSWLLEHLVTRNVLERDDIRILDDFDEYLCKKGLSLLNNDHFDFIHEAFGIAYYFLQRIHKKQSLVFLNDFIDIIYKKSHFKSTNGSCFLKVLDVVKGIKHINFGLAHGLPSFIVFFSKTTKLGINKQKSIELINGYINFLLEHKFNSINSLSLFPNSDKDSERYKPSRLAWCYGDLGISTSIFQAASTLNRKDLEQTALDIILHSAKRLNLEENFVFDAGICHGTAGIAHIYNRLYRNTQKVELKLASNYWIEQTLKMSFFEDGFAGYKAWNGYKIGWKKEIGLLEGVSGIGLALISAVSDIEPAWDECLLLS
jgi:lantibiotic modifying enzyme